MTRRERLTRQLMQHLTVLLIAVSFLTGTLSRAQTTLQREYTKDNPLVYEDAYDLWPYSFLDDAGNPTGYNVDLVQMILSKLNIPYKINLVPTSQALEDLRSRKSDLMLGMVANFHDNYTLHYGKNSIQLFTHSVVYPKKSTMRVQTINDLSSQKVIVHEGSFSHHLMEDRGWGDNAIPHADMIRAVMDVSSEENGQVLWNTMSLKWIIHKYDIDNLSIAPVEMPSGDYRFMANDPQLLEMLDNTFELLRSEDQLIPLEEKWFYPEKAKTESSIPMWTSIVLAFILLVSLIMLLSSLAYRIQERKKTQEGRLHNERLKMILKACNVRIFTYNVRQQLFTWHDNSTALTRTYSPAEFAEHYHPEDYKRLSTAIEQMAKGEIDEEQMDMAVVDSMTAKKRLFNIRLSVLRHDKDSDITIIGTMNDVTEEYEKQLESSYVLNRYGSVFSTAMVDMVYYDSRGYIVDMNERSQINLNLPLETALRNRVNIRELLGADEFDFNEFVSNGRFYATIFLNDKTGLAMTYTKRRNAMKFYELQLVAVTNDQQQLLGIYGTGREVTEMAKTYQKAQEGVAQLRKAMKEEAEYINNINYALQVGGIRRISYSPEDHMLTINHRMHEAQYVLTQQRCLQLAGPECERQIMRAFRTMDNKKDTEIDCDIRTNLRLPNDRRLCLLTNLFPTKDSNGNVKAFTGICRDTSEIIHTEMMLQQNTEKAQEIEKVKNQFLHNMCQEIRTPLNVVVGYAEMFESSNSPDEEELFINEIKENTSYLLNLINDILFLSRLDAGMVELNLQPCDFAKTFDGHCTMGMSHKINEGVKFNVENHYQQLELLIDDANIGRIIQQLLDNAFEHTKKGSIRARYEYIGGKLIISISDTGEGIPPEKVKHLFERFNATDQQSTRGTGLGLPICKEIATLLGGTIDVNTEVGKGTTVWLTIPCEAIKIVHKKEE